MRTTVSIKGLQLHAHHGLDDAERRLGQRFLFDVRCRLGKVASHLEDGLQHSVGYNVLAVEIAGISSSRKFHTIEALAETIARHLLDRYPLIEALEVAVAKYSPPMPYLLDTASVEISLTRDKICSTV